MTLPGFAGTVPSGRNVAVELGLRATAEAAVDQSQGMANAGEPRHRLGISDRRFRFILRKQVKHPSELAGQR